jgi:hypothetical protein
VARNITPSPDDELTEILEAVLYDQPPTREDLQLSLSWDTDEGQIRARTVENLLDGIYNTLGMDNNFDDEWTVEAHSTKARMSIILRRIRLARTIRKGKLKAALRPRPTLPNEDASRYTKKQYERDAIFVRLLTQRRTILPSV